MLAHPFCNNLQPVQPEITTDIFNYEKHEKHEK